MTADKSNANGFLKEIEELRVRAKAGDPEAQIGIARKLLNAIRQGQITSREGNGDAFRWVRTAEINPALTDEQRIELAEILWEDRTNNNTPPFANLPKAIRLLLHVYKYGADNARGNAAYNLGRIYQQPLFELSRIGHSQKVKKCKQTWRNIPRSFVWFRRAARAGNTPAADILHMHYLLGLDVLANGNKACYWQARTKEILETRQSPTHDDRFVRRAMERRERREHGKYITPQRTFESAKAKLLSAESEESVRKAMETLQKCANENGYAPAMALWSEEILDTEQKSSYAMAKIFLRDAARQGHPGALAIAGRWLLTGGRGVQQDIKLARKFLDRAATVGNAYALAIQCRCALNGWGEPKNSGKAKELWKRAEKQAIVQSNGRCLYELFLLKKELENKVSFPLLRAAAENGHVQACFELGRRYNRGLDTPLDRDEARIWLQKAAIRRHPLAPYELSELFRKGLFQGGLQESIPWLVKAFRLGDPRAAIQIGIYRITGKTDLIQNWQEAERLFRRFCPLHPTIGYDGTIIEHFLAKPTTKRSDRDCCFLDRVRHYLRYNDPLKAARLFRLEDPTFAAECDAVAEGVEEEQGEFEKRLKEILFRLSEAEADWQSGKQLRAGETFVKWATWLSSDASRGFFRSLEKYKHDKETMLRVDESFSRCLWRGVQTLWHDNDLTTDTKKTIDHWTRRVLWDYRPSRRSAMASTLPDIIRDAAIFCCQTTTSKVLSLSTRVLGHEVAALFGDAEALTWLLEHININELRWYKAMYIKMGVEAEIPLALRLEADHLDALPGSPDPARVAELLRNAADLGDAEAQCRQGEALLQNKEPEDWRQQAKEWFLKAAAQRHERASMYLGQLLAAESSEDASKDAITWLEKAAKTSDVSLRTSAECELGKLFLQRREWATAALHLKKAAQNDNCAAMELLALEPNLRGTLSDDEIREWCLAWLDLPGTAGDNNGRVLEYLGVKTVGKIGGRVLTRLGRVAKDKHESADWFRKAAEAGDGPGAYEWARCLLYGDGCDRNYSEAEKWLRKAWNILDGNSDLKAYASAWNGFLSALKERQAAEAPVASEQEENLRDEVTTEAMDAGHG